MGQWNSGEYELNGDGKVPALSQEQIDNIDDSPTSVVYNKTLQKIGYIKSQVFYEFGTGGGGGGQSQQNFVIEFMPGTYYEIIPNNFTECEIAQAVMYTDDGTLDVTLEINSVPIPGINAEEVTVSPTTLTPTSTATLPVNGILTIKCENIVDGTIIKGSIQII